MSSDSLSHSALIEAYRLMFLFRFVEERIFKLYQAGEIGGFCHLYIGQEAVFTGLNSLSQKDDACVTSYRDHVHAIGCGLSIESVIAELLGKESGCSHGKGGSMHLFHPEGGFYGGHGIVGAQAPLGAGLAFAKKYKKLNAVVFTYLGDGAANQGQFFESMNMAALWKLPVVYVIENNLYGMGTSTVRSHACHDSLYKRGEPFGIPGKKINGMSFLDVVNDSMDLVAYCREHSSPVILEMETYRYKGHSMSDPAQYRSKNEVNDYKNMDCIQQLGQYLIDKKIASADQLKEIEKKVKSEVIAEEERAVGASFPSDSDLYTHVFIDR